MRTCRLGLLALCWIISPEALPDGPKAFTQVESGDGCNLMYRRGRALMPDRETRERCADKKPPGRGTIQYCTRHYRPMSTPQLQLTLQTLRAQERRAAAGERVDLAFGPDPFLTLKVEMECVQEFLWDRKVQTWDPTSKPLIGRH